MNTEPKFVKLDLPLNHPLLPKHYDNDRSKPEDELKALNTTIEQTSACYKDGHYIAAIGLCGRIIEILIVNAYKREFKTDPLTAEIDDRTKRVTPMSVRRMRRGLQKKGVSLFNDVVDSQLNLIQNSRNISAHGSVTIPNKQDANQVVDYTVEFIERIIYYYTPNDDHIQRGKARVNFGNHQEAIEDFDRIIGAAAGNSTKLAEAYYNRGLSKAALNEHDEAIENFTESINLKWSLAKNHLNQGKAKFSLGQSEEAIKDFNEAINGKKKLQNDDLAEAYYNRGRAKYRLGKSEEAGADFDEAIKQKEDFAEAYYNRGLAKQNLAQFEAAIVDFDRTLRLDPNNAYAYKARGLAKCRLDQYESAIVDFSDVIELKSDLADAYFQRGRARNELEQYESAITDFDKSIGEKTDYIDAYFQRGFAKNKLKQYKEAIRDFDRVIKEKPDHTDAHSQRELAKAEIDRPILPVVHPIPRPPEPKPEGSEFWAPIRRGEFGALFAGKPVPVRDDGWISKRIRGVELILSFRKNCSYVSFLCRGENRIERRDEIIALFPEADYDYSPRESSQRAGFKFPVINKGKDHPEDWGEIREKLVAMGTDIYDKIKESDL